MVDGRFMAAPQGLIFIDKEQSLRGNFANRRTSRAATRAGTPVC